MNMNASLFVTFPAGTVAEVIDHTCREILTWGRTSFDIVETEILSVEAQDDGTLVAHATGDNCIEHCARARAEHLCSARFIVGWQLLI